MYLAKSDSSNVLRRAAGGGLFADFLPPFTIVGTGITFGPNGSLYVLANDRVAEYNGTTAAAAGLRSRRLGTHPPRDIPG